MCPKRVRRHEWTIAVNLGRPVNLWISLFLTNWCRNIILSQSPVQVSLHTATTFHLSLTKVFFQKSLHVRSALSKATQADRRELTDTENMAGHCVLTVRQSVEITDVSGHCWIVFGQARATVMRATRNGVSPTTNYVTVEKSRQCHTSSTLVHWPSLTAVYCAYMKQMRLPSTGWQHMALSTR